MKTLLYKELKLAVHPTSLLFLSLSAMLLIPNYPYYVAFFYTCLGIFFTCLQGRENHDIFYTLLLPIRKRDMVKMRIALIVLIEISQILLAIPFAFIRQTYPFPNAAGMEANIAFFGISFLLFGAFNYFFLTKYYQNPDKVGFAFLLGTSAFTMLMFLAEASVHIVPFVKEKLDTNDPAFFSEKLLILFLGIALYAFLTFLAYRKSVKSFEQLDF